MGMTITDEQIAKLRKAFENNPSNIVAQNAVTNVQLPKLALNRSVVQNTDNTFSTKFAAWKVTAQKSSAR